MDYLLSILEPLKGLTLRVAHYIPTLVLAFVVLFAGWLIARGVRKLFDRLFHLIQLDKFAQKAGIAAVLRNGGIRHKVSGLLSCLLYWIVMIFTLMATFKVLGLTVVTHAIDSLVAYIPSVFTGALILIIGMLLAKVISSIIFVTAKNTDMPIPEGLRELSKWAIVIYVTVIYLKEVGFTALFVGMNYTILIGGIVFAAALAFGLAGKDIAHKYLDVFNVGKHGHK